MEYAKDEVFKIKRDRLDMSGEKWYFKVSKMMKRHKLMTTTIIAFFIFSFINIAMVYSFMNILQNL